MNGNKKLEIKEVTIKTRKNYVGVELTTLVGYDKEGNKYTAHECWADCGAVWIEVTKNGETVGDVSLIRGSGTACGHGSIVTNETAEKIYYDLLQCKNTKEVYEDWVIE